MPTLLTHHRFWMQATWYFQSFGSTFMRLWALVTSALRMMKVSPCVGGCHVRGSHLPPQGGPCLGGLGGMGQGPRHLGVAPLLRVSTTESIIPLGPRVWGAGWCCGGPSQGPRHLETAPAPAGEHPSVPESGARSRWGWSAAVLSQWMAWRQSPTIGAVVFSSALCSRLGFSH